MSKVDGFNNNELTGDAVVGTHSIESDWRLKRPRRVMLMVKAGDTVDNSSSIDATV